MILYSIIYIMETKKQIFSIASNHLKFKKPWKKIQEYTVTLLHLVARDHSWREIQKIHLSFTMENKWKHLSLRFPCTSQKSSSKTRTNRHEENSVNLSSIREMVKKSQPVQEAWTSLLIFKTKEANTRRQWPRQLKERAP